MPPKPHQGNPSRGGPAAFTYEPLHNQVSAKLSAATFPTVDSTSINSRKRIAEGAPGGDSQGRSNTADQDKRTIKRAKHDDPPVPLKERGSKSIHLTPNSDLNVVNMNKHFTSIPYSAEIARWFQHLGGVQHYPVSWLFEFCVYMLTSGAPLQVCTECKEHGSTHHCKPSRDKNRTLRARCTECARRHLSCGGVFSYRLWLAHIDTGLSEAHILAVMVSRMA